MSPSRCVSACYRLRVAWWMSVVLACTGVVNAAEPAAAQQLQSPAETQFAEGLRLAAANQLPAAIDVFARLTRDYPQLPQPYAQLAALYVRQGEPAKAIAPLHRALSLDSGQPALQEQLGDLYVELAARAYASAGTTRQSARTKAAALSPLHQNQPASNQSR